VLDARTGRAAHHVGGFDDFGDAGAMGGRFDALVKEWTTDCVGAPAKEKDVMLVVAKKAHGQTRLAELDLRPNRDDVYTKIAQLLTDRL
jgi:hypothetical protein